MQKTSKQVEAVERPTEFTQDDVYLFLACVFIPFLIYIVTSARYIQPGNAAEFAVVFREMSLSHLGGSPIASLIGNLYYKFSLVIFNFESSYLINLFSISCIALSSGFIYLILCMFTSRRILSVITTMMGACSALFWTQTIQSDVTPFFTLSLTIFIYVWLKWIEVGSTFYLLLTSFLLATLIGIHPIALLLIPGLLISLIVKLKNIKSRTEFLLAILYFILGLNWVFFNWIRGADSWIIGSETRPDSFLNLIDFTIGLQYYELFSFSNIPWPNYGLVERILFTPLFYLYCLAGFGLIPFVRGIFSGFKRHPLIATYFLTFLFGIFGIFTFDIKIDFSRTLLFTAPFIPIFLLFGIEAILESNLQQGNPISLTLKKTYQITFTILALQLLAFPVFSIVTDKNLPEIKYSSNLTLVEKLIQYITIGLKDLKVLATSEKDEHQHIIDMNESIGIFDGPKVIVTTWELQTLLTWYQRSNDMFLDTKIFELTENPRFYRYGKTDVVIDNSNQKTKQPGELFILLRADESKKLPEWKLFKTRITDKIGEYVFHKQSYELFHVHPELPPPQPLETITPTQLPQAVGDKTINDFSRF